MSNRNPLVTVMIPTYNQEAYIDRALKSILEQSYNNIEIIVSDDSPHSNTGKIILNNYNYKNIKYIHHKKSKGRVNNYHFVLYEVAQGEWVVNLDGDDYFDDKDFISKAVNIVIKNPDIVMVVGQQKIYNEKKQTFNYPAKIIKDNYQIIPGNSLFLNSVFKNIEIPHLATLYNRKKAIEIGFYNKDIISSDRLSLLKLMLNNKVALLNSCAGVWVHHQDNISQNMNFKNIFDNLILYDYLYVYGKNNTKINKTLLFIWKNLGKYKNIYGYALDVINKKDFNCFFYFYKKTSRKCLSCFILMSIDLRIYLKIIKVYIVRSLYCIISFKKSIVKKS